MGEVVGSNPTESTIVSLTWSTKRGIWVWILYILRCSDDSLYTGITNDFPKRIKQHNSGKGSKYTRARLPVSVVYTEDFDIKSSALKREIQIKRLTRSAKLQLVEKK